MKSDDLTTLPFYEFLDTIKRNGLTSKLAKDLLRECWSGIIFSRRQLLASDFLALNRDRRPKVPLGICLALSKAPGNSNHMNLCNSTVTDFIDSWRYLRVQGRILACFNKITE